MTQTAVVVATHNRAGLLPRLFRALEAQQPPPAEVVIVDDASTDGTAAALRALTAASPLPVTVITLERNAGPATARNRGWRATTAPVVAFTDDDCAPQPGWLAALASAAGASGVAQGRTEPDPGQRELLGPFSRTMHVPELNWFFQTCNIAYRREWLERTGGFDEQFRYPMGEDTDLALRALAAGAEAAFAEDALVFHDVRASDFLVKLRDTRRWESVALVVRKHPEFRRHLYRPYFWKPAHPPVIAAATGLVLLASARRMPFRLAAAALLAPYLKHRLADSPLPWVRRRQRLALLPAAFALDLAEVAVLARASWRYRTLVL